MCDGKKSLRFVGFASNHQEFLEKRKSVEIRNCQIKKSKRDSDKLELLVKGATKIYPSTKKFDVSAVEFQNTEATEITLNQVDENHHQCRCESGELWRINYSWNQAKTRSKSR